MKIEICKKALQKAGFSAYIPKDFPVQGMLDIPQEVINKAGEAERLIGKLDGITQTLPNIEFFLRMYSLKDATSSAQIEGTRATLFDAIELDAGLDGEETDADDILFYLIALGYGMDRIKKFPLSLRFIRELHSKLMKGARSTQFSDPGEFRRTQNWIGGTSPANATFVPPPVTEMNKALEDFEKFIHNKDITLPIIAIAFAHAQFETIHPFLDGNGRTGRLLITFLIYERKLLENPVLFLSSYFRKHQKLYYNKLNGYHDGEVLEWLDFFLDGVIEIAQQSIDTSKKITELRTNDMLKIQALAKRESGSGVLVLQKLYETPIVNVRKIMDWTNFSRPGAQKLIDRFIELSILKAQDEQDTYDRKYKYDKYLKAFTD